MVNTKTIKQLACKELFGICLSEADAEQYCGKLCKEDDSRLKYYILKKQLCSQSEKSSNLLR